MYFNLHASSKTPTQRPVFTTLLFRPFANESFMDGRFSLDYTQNMLLEDKGVT